MKIAFALFAHLPTDERIFFHQAKSLQKNNCSIAICSAYMNEQKNYPINNNIYDNAQTETIKINQNKQSTLFISTVNNITIYNFSHAEMPHNTAISVLSKCLQLYMPEIVICDNPLSVIAANKYKKNTQNKIRILYDITEWYPSKKNLVNLNILRKIVKSTVLKAVNFYAGLLTNGFIFGEYYKAKPFKKLFPNKPYINLPYYPDLSFFNSAHSFIHNDILSNKKTWHLAYCGNTTNEKGFDTVCKIVQKVATNNPNISFIFNIISSQPDNYSKYLNPAKNLSIETKNFMPFQDFCNEIAQYDIFFDLRIIDKENNHCLPIKLFYYIACGKPVIFSNLKAIRKEIPEYSTFVYLVDENIVDTCTSLVENYIKTIQSPNSEYIRHSKTALQLAKEKYNWNYIEQRLINFIIHGQQ